MPLGTHMDLVAFEDEVTHDYAVCLGGHQIGTMPHSQVTATHNSSVQVALIAWLGDQLTLAAQKDSRGE